MLMTFGGNRCSVFSHSLTAFPHLLPPTVSAPWALSTWTQGDQSVIKGSLLQVLRTSGFLFFSSSKINLLFHIHWSPADPYWIIRTIFARMSMNDSETVALIGDYRLQYRKYFAFKSKNWGKGRPDYEYNSWKYIWASISCILVFNSFARLSIVYFVFISKVVDTRLGSVMVPAILVK